MEPRKIKMLLHDDLMYQILLWLPVISILRFKLVCKTWQALIESKDFIKQHLHHHHHDPNLKDKNQSLIRLITGKDSPITCTLTSIDSFEEPSTCVQLNCSDLCGYAVVDIVSYNGIVCLNLLNCKLEHSIWLWNPATKQSRVLPQSPALNRSHALDKVTTPIGFGFDVKNNDHKVVNLIKSLYGDEKRVEVYSLNTSSWRSVTIIFPFLMFTGNSRMPFNNGTCFFWLGYNSPKDTGIFCFDFCSEVFRSISFPCADYFPLFCQIKLISVVRDKIACVFRTNDRQIEIWVFNEYGTVNESWTKLYRIDTSLMIDRKMRIVGVSMNGDYIFFKRMGQMCRLNVVTKETNCFTLENKHCSFDKNMVEFKESLVSVLDA